MNNFKVAAVKRDLALDAALDPANGGKLRIYSGSQPSTADTAIVAQVLLAELTMGSPAFASASGGTKTAQPITSDAAANASGTATWFRLVQSDTTTPVCDGTAGTSGTDLILDDDDLTVGGPVSVASFTVSLPA